MRFFQILFLIIFAFILNSCSTVLSQLNGINSNIPRVQNIKTIVGVNSVAFEWDIINNPIVTGYVVYRDSGDGYREIAHIANPLSTHYVDSFLSPERQYSYYFHAISKNSYSDRSDIIKIKTSFIEPVSSVYASNDYPRKIKIIWSPHINPSIDHYMIQRSDGNNVFKTIATVKNRLSVEYFDENLGDEVSYQYRVIAVDFLGAPSRPSKIISAKTKDRPRLDINLSASLDLPSVIEVNWNKQEGISQYRVYRSNTIDGTYKLIATTNEIKFIDKIKSPNVQYFYRVSGIDSYDIESSVSKPIAGRTKPLLETPEISRGYIDNNRARIEWKEVKDAKYYLVYRSGGFFEDALKFKAISNEFIDSDMVSNKKYTYYVVAVDDLGIESLKSKEIVLQIK